MPRLKTWACQKPFGLIAEQGCGRAKVIVKDLKDKLIAEVRQLGCKHMVEKAILFRYRSSSDNHPLWLEVH